MLRYACIALIALAAAACSTQTGFMIEVRGPAGQSSVDAGVVTLELIASHRSWCERWVEDASASHARADVRGRDLSKQPYEFLIKPSHFTDLSDPVAVLVLGRDANDQVIGVATYDAHPYRLHQIDKYSAHLGLLPAGAASGVAADGCVCLPGLPWMGSGSGTGCDPLVVTSFARFIDTAGCELPTGARQLSGPVCDGQQYFDEPADRALPCYAPASGGWAIGTPTCHDRDGVAYTDVCAPDASAPVAPGTTLCDAYTACAEQACGDVIGCFLQKVPAVTTFNCTLRIQPDSAPGTPIQPCAFDGQWQAQLPLQATGTGCVASVIEGTAQPPFTLGLIDAQATGPQAVASSCPVTFTVDSIDADSPADVPDTKDLDLTVGAHRVHLHIAVQRACSDGVASLVCQQ